MTDPVVLVNGGPVAAAEARVSVFDRGFLFGDSVFEVLRTYHGAPFALDEHLARLERSLAGLGIGAPPRAVLEAEIAEALARLELRDAYIRVVVTRGEGPLHLDPRRAHGPSTRVVIAAPLLPLPASLYEGVALASVWAYRATDHSRAAGAKVSAYVSNLLALAAAQERGAYEAVFAADDGSLSEGSSSNLFLIEGGALVTPPLSTGILGGVTRAAVLEVGRSRGCAVHERVLFARDFERADECFLTSSLREVVPVIALDGVPVGRGRPGPVTRALHEGYRVHVARLLAVDAPGAVG